MSNAEQVRPDVVAAIVTALEETDPSNLPPDATRAEKDAAKDQYLSGLVAGRAQRERQTRAWELLLTRSHDEPPSWQQLFDELPQSSVDQLADLYDALPEGAQTEYARRYGAPVSA
ncbi:MULTISPECIES: hypothetical protein [unclassified Modestobacter]|uniref:hypothetical protein n=1 Tax=unclassified Modestobacter TaxID=2643866 RepID=UPI0022AA5C16|nr:MULTISPECIES: hypothetical protein [unclassified Modestobacter]MCZ2813487.1 hypothetical protein [Modestobacter sp. VKM Ac-2979]MCZ2842321.1 hypothetical protein [Modestobacter sp. VKM Ac-2980]MCZ2846643.1 hypothetical protein [Modestobacter sp. VKM Ac-2978]